LRDLAKGPDGREAKNGEELTMALDAVLKQLESRIEELVSAYGESKKREAELAAKVKKLGEQVASEAEVGDRVAALEKQRDELGKRLEKVLELIDGTLAETD
jgi:predicted RNase H-like nuclease (RuvC/YqgF family)